MAKGDKLNERQKAFVNEFIKDMNASAAYVRIGGPRKNANVNGPRMLANAGVASEIQKRLRRVEEHADITAARVLKRLADIMDADVRRAYNSDGTLKPINEIPDDLAQAVSSIESDDASGDVRKLRFCDKVRAAELLAKHLGILTDNVRHSGRIETNVPPPAKIDLNHLGKAQLDGLIAKVDRLLAA